MIYSGENRVQKFLTVLCNITLSFFLVSLYALEETSGATGFSLGCCLLLFIARANCCFSVMNCRIGSVTPLNAMNEFAFSVIKETN